MKITHDVPAEAVAAAVGERSRGAADAAVPAVRRTR